MKVAKDIPKDGKLYWMKPDPRDDTHGCHAFRRWDASKGRFEDHIEPVGMQRLVSRHQSIPAIPPRFDGTELKEGAGYEPIEIT